ncbi:MAG: hypothetical protein ACTSVI_16565 [Promethearchaeota archaeon]
MGITSANKCYCKTKDLGAYVSFLRLRRYRKVTSIPFSDEYSIGGPHPDDDGLFIMNLQTGKLELIYSLDDGWNASAETRNLSTEIFKSLNMGLWFNHVSFNHSSKRLHFLSRFSNLFGWLITSM